MRTASLVAIVVVALIWASPVIGESDGVSPGEIHLGQSCALTGPAQALGKGMRAGLLAAFEEANAEGGIHGRRIRLTSLDDGYEPDRAILNVRKLIEQEGVFLLIGEVGTPTSQAVVPMAEAAKVPFFGPFTGAEFLRNPYRRYVINVRGSYYQEMEEHASQLVDKMGIERIACFYQNDGYGQAGLKGIELALQRRGMELVGSASYPRNTLAVKSSLLKIRRTHPQAVLMVGSYRPVAEFIRLARGLGMSETIFGNLSFVGSQALLADLGGDAENCVVSQVVMSPYDSSVPLVADYNRAMSEYQPYAETGYVSLEGYLVGRFFVAAAQIAGPELTREGLIDAINQTREFDLGGIVLQFGAEDHQGMDEVYWSPLLAPTASAR